MKIKVSLKDPDGFSDSVDAAIKEDTDKLDLSEDEAEAVIERRTKRVWDALAKFVEYQEYLVVEFDTDADTATVVRRAGK